MPWSFPELTRNGALRLLGAFDPILLDCFDVRERGLQFFVYRVTEIGGERLRDAERWKHGVPPWATPTLPGCSISSMTSRPPAWPTSCSPTA